MLNSVTTGTPATSPRTRLGPDERRRQLLGIGLRMLVDKPIQDLSLDAVAQGRQIINRAGCGACHQIPGVAWPEGRLGPSLAGFADRLSAFDIHPTGPLWGRGEPRSESDARGLELEALADRHSLALRHGLEAAGLKQERRATRLRPRDLSWSWLDGAILELRFALPPGTYATTVLAELAAT